MKVISAYVESAGSGFDAVIGFRSEQGYEKSNITRFDSFRDAVSFIEAHDIGMPEDKAIEVYNSFFPPDPWDERGWN